MNGGYSAEGWIRLLRTFHYFGRADDANTSSEAEENLKVRIAQIRTVRDG
jgi:hypothetical protein